MADMKENSGGDRAMSEEEYALFRKLLAGEFGIVLKGDRRSTLHAKLSHRLAVLGIASYRDYYDLITSEASGEELFHCISHITNSETYFLRETGRITLFTSLLSEVKRYRQKKNQNRITIFSAGCATGEEVYTLNIMLIESGLFAWGWDVRIIGVDVNMRALTKARGAAYTKNSFRASDGHEDFSRKYFDKRDDAYVLKKAYRSHVEFRRGNILDPRSLDGIDEIDILFCRNVFIYMGEEAIRRVARNFYDHLADEGYLFIGSSESLLNKTELFTPQFKEGSVVYRKALGPSPENGGD
ncbi:MAG: protein-glutamate O-methyltransferase CheR [Nitrospirae bacterium]|nr:protein-glutamate O-methyltransferase CheR [Nitrospirota bacterium]